MKFRFALVSITAFALAATLAAQTKITGTASCKADPMTPVEVGDTPGHALGVQKSPCSWTGLEMAGSAAKDGVSVANVEIRGNNASSRGYHTGTLASGDKWTCSFQGKSVSKDGKPVSDSGTWAFTSGTGKLKGIKGKGTYKGTANPDGTMAVAIEGEYSVP
jgi:hypothetical protein